jgi:aldehyde dehydrogenase (NAD+)
VVWVNGTNLFDAACGFGGYRESGFGREGGREGMLEYLVPVSREEGSRHRALALPRRRRSQEAGDGAFIDRTPKLFIGGKQVRPDGNYSYPSTTPKAGLPARPASAAARTSATRSRRPQIRLGFRHRPQPRPGAVLPGRKPRHPRRRVRNPHRLAHRRLGQGRPRRGRRRDRAHLRRRRHGRQVRRLGPPAAHARHRARPARARRHARHRRPDDQPLLGLVAMLAPALAMGNAVVAVPSPRHALVATDLYQVFETSDLPAGAVNIVTGKPAELAAVLAKHDDLDGLWCVADAETCRVAELESAGNLKRVWTSGGRKVDWDGPEGRPARLPAPRGRNQECLGALRRLMPGKEGMNR